MVNEKLRTEIRKRYKSESELAEQMGWTRQKLSKTIRGERNPKISDVNALSRAMDIPVGEVISLFLPNESPKGLLLGREGGESA